MLANIPPGGLLHVAAHGHHVAESPMFSAVLLADGPLFGYDIAPNPALPDHVVLSSCDVDSPLISRVVNLSAWPLRCSGSGTWRRGQQDR